jgi:hypothetical protein
MERVCRSRKQCFSCLTLKHFFVYIQPFPLIRACAHILLKKSSNSNLNMSFMDGFKIIFGKILVLWIIAIAVVRYDYCKCVRLKSMDKPASRSQTCAIIIVSNA